jgi:hypothetical protein
MVLWAQNVAHAKKLFDCVMLYCPDMAAGQTGNISLAWFGTQVCPALKAVKM